MIQQPGVLLGKLAIVFALTAVTLAAQVPSIAFVVLPALPDPWKGYRMLRRVAACESTGDVNGTPRQFNLDGSPLWGNDRKTGLPVKRDVGILQINTNAHKAELGVLKLDVVNSEADNIAYGKLLYVREGLRPWLGSKKCWSGADKNQV